MRIVDIEKNILELTRSKDKTLVFVYTQSDLYDIVRVIDKAIAGDDKLCVVMMNSEAPLHFDGFDALTQRIKIGEDYLEASDYESIDDFVYRLTTGWHLLEDPGIKTAVWHNEVNMGKVVEFDFQLFLVRRIKMFAMLNEAVKIERPDKVVIISDSPEEFRGITELVGGLHGVPLHAYFMDSENERHSFSLKTGMSGILTDIISIIADRIAIRRLNRSINGKGCVLVDNRILNDLSENASIPENFTTALFEKGFRLRLGVLKNKGAYYPFIFPPNFYFKIPMAKNSMARQLEQKLRVDDLFKFRGISIFSIAKPRLEEYLNYTFPRVAANIDHFESFLKHNTVKGVVLRHDLWELQRLSVELGKRYGVPTIVVQHGIFGEKLERVIFADKIAVWGDMCARIYESFGNDRLKCFVTGNHKHDRLHNTARPGSDRNDVCAKLGLDPAKLIVVFLSGPVHSIYSAYVNRDRSQATLKHVIKTMSGFSDKQLIVKLHPYEEAVFAEEAIRHFNSKNTVVVKDFDLRSLLNAADLVISRESSDGLKALILGKPLVTLNFEKRADVVPYAPSGAAVGVYDPGRISETVMRIFNDKSFRDELSRKSSVFVREYAYSIDGKSSERVIDFIQNTIGRVRNERGSEGRG